MQLIDEDESDRDDYSKCTARLFADGESQHEVSTIARCLGGINIGLTAPTKARMCIYGVVMVCHFA